MLKFFTLLLLSVLPYSLIAQLVPDISKSTTEIVTTEGHIQIINKKEAIFTYKTRVTVLNKESKANNFHVFYNPDNKIIDINAAIFDIYGNRIRKVRKSEISDISAIDGISIYTENRLRYIHLSNPQYPYIIEFSYKKKLGGILFAALPNWHFQESNTTFVKKSTFSLSLPDGIGFQHKMYNLDISPKINKLENETVYTWSAENIASFEYEDFSPPIHRLTPILRISPEEFEIEGYQGSMKSWNAYGLFMNQLWDKKEDIPEELSQKINALTAIAKTDREKIQLLYQYMQENMRYLSVQLGIGGWQPFSASYVNENKYGDCKALSNFMRAMLNDINIESYPVIIQAGDPFPYEVEDNFVDPSFNHVILYVPQEDIWLECTSSNAPPGYLGSFCNDRKVLLVTPEGGLLSRTPKLDTKENLAQEETSISIHTDGSAQIAYHADFSGIAHEKWRDIAHSLSLEEMKNQLRQQGNLPNITFDALTITSDSLNPISKVDYTAFAQRYASKAGKRLFVPLNPICPQQFIPEDIEKRKNSIVFPYGYTKKTSISFILPEGYFIESIPDNKKLETVFGKYSLTITQKEKLVIVERQFEFYGKEQMAEQYKTLRSFYLEMAKYDDAKMVLVHQ